MLVAADETTEEKKDRESKEKQEFERRESILSSNGVSFTQLYLHKQILVNQFTL